MITHHVEELLPETSHVLVLKAGHVAASGSPKKVLTSTVLSSVYDCPVRVESSGPTGLASGYLCGMEEGFVKHFWDANLYDHNHSFVNQMAFDLVTLLNPKTGEHILDLGCGTGSLTQKIAESGANVFGIDASAAMIAKARKNFPALSFDVIDALTMHFDQEFDAVFSNAVLHWIRPPQRAIERMYHSLKTGGRLVLEMGGKGNVSTILTAAIDVGHQIGIDLALVIDINYFPSIGQYATLLEQAGFCVQAAILFDRPTPLADGHVGLLNWIKMFRPGVVELVPEGHLDEFATLLQTSCRTKLLKAGIWYADYRRLRITALK